MKRRPNGSRSAITPNPVLAGTCLVELTRGLFAIIDEVDAAIVGTHLWRATSHSSSLTFYAGRTERLLSGERRHVTLHEFLWSSWGSPGQHHLDHANLNGLDCRRINLRPADASQSQANRRRQCNNKSGFKGVSWNKQAESWEARIGIDGKHVHLGYFNDIALAGAAYEKAAREHYGEFARIDSAEAQS